MDKCACPWVIIDFIFKQQQPKLGYTDVIRCSLTSSIEGVCYQVCWHGTETNKVCWIHSCSCPWYFQLRFLTGTALYIASLLLTLADAIPYENPYSTVLQFYFLAYTSLFSIKSNVLKLDTVQKVYSVNKGSLLGVVSSPWFVYMGRYLQDHAI